jgi:NAD(P)-dependent dehydrogenase (short-subunit alcohol dehydrogenase family)
MTQAHPELDGKVCVVTGGGRGIGAAIASRLVEAGARVAILEGNPELSRSIEARFAEQGAAMRSFETDVADEHAVIAAAERVQNELGPVDALVNNAGIGRLGPSMSFPVKDFRDSLDVMVTGVFLCSREFGKSMRTNGGGAIVNISSINGLVAFPMRLAYSAAKSAVISMTKILAVEWAAYGIRVNAVAPGNTETEMLKEAMDQGLIDVDAYMAHTPLRRFAQPAEIADTVEYLISARAAYLTGQVMVPDGGWTSFGWIPWTGDPDAPGVRA